MSPPFDEAYCAEYLEAVELIGARWSGAIIRVLFCEVTRFSDIASSIPGLSDRLLSVRLRELEAAGVIQAVIPNGRARAEYRLTPKGRDLADALMALEGWAKRWKSRTRPKASSIRISPRPLA